VSGKREGCTLEKPAKCPVCQTGHFPENARMGPDAFRAIIGIGTAKKVHSGVFRIWVKFCPGFFKRWKGAGREKSAAKAQYGASERIIYTSI